MTTNPNPAKNIDSCHMWHLGMLASLWYLDEIGATSTHALMRSFWLWRTISTIRYVMPQVWRTRCLLDQPNSLGESATSLHSIFFSSLLFALVVGWSVVRWCAFSPRQLACILIRGRRRRLAWAALFFFWNIVISSPSDLATTVLASIIVWLSASL